MTSAAADGGIVHDRADTRDGAYARFPVIQLRGVLLNCICPVRGTRYYLLPCSPEIPRRATAMAALSRQLSLLQRRAAARYRSHSR